MRNDDSNDRIDPDLLLKSIQKTTHSDTGQLRIFFGMCPGVGKTFAMLKAAQAQRQLGKNIVIGVVETHGRPETEALVEGLEKVRLKRIRHRDTEILEMDLDRILQLKPEIVLVDELAHTNAPGSRHPKRYQDVSELLEAGIDVYTTLNVQHVASRADIVSQITGISIRETVPDSIFEYAHRVELIDLTSEELLQRLKEGKVYLGDRAVRAQENFFKPDHLTALRELALRFTAEVVDNELQSRRIVNQVKTPWKTVERFLVAVSQSPFSESLIRTTRRMAFRINAPWIALYVETGKKLEKQDLDRLHQNLALAKELGAEVVTTRDENIASAIKRVALEKNITQIVVGRPIRRFFSDRLHGGTLLDALVTEVSEIDIHVVRQKRVSQPLPKRVVFPGFEFQSGFLSYWNVSWFLCGVTFLGLLLEGILGYRAIGFVYLLAVVTVSMLAARGPILFAGFACSVLWNFFFIPPKFNFSISAPEDFMMCCMFFVVAITMGTSAAKLRRKDKILLQREKRAQILYKLTQNLAAVSDKEAVVEVTLRSIKEIFDTDSVLFIEGEHGLSHQAMNPFQVHFDDKDFSQASWTYKNREKAGLGTHTLTSARAITLPLNGREKTIGVLLFYPEKKKQRLVLSIEQENLLDTICNHLALTLEHLSFEEALHNAKVLEQSDKLYRTLLDSVSHELRTPLTGIIGSISAFQDPATFKNKELVHLLSENILNSSRRLNRVIENLLDMSRLNSGVYQIKKDIISLEDVLRQSIKSCTPELADHRMKTHFPETPIYLLGDDRLLEHVFNNLIINASQYSPKGTEILIDVTKRGADFGVCTVSNDGAPIPEASISDLFEKFYRVPGSPPGGTGLGLSIVKEIVEAHDGRVEVENRSGPSGVSFRVLLPHVNIPRQL